MDSLANKITGDAIGLQFSGRVKVGIWNKVDNNLHCVRYLKLLEAIT